MIKATMDDPPTVPSPVGPDVSVPFCLLINPYHEGLQTGSERTSCRASSQTNVEKQRLTGLFTGDRGPGEKNDVERDEGRLEKTRCRVIILDDGQN